MGVQHVNGLRDKYTEKNRKVNGCERKKGEILFSQIPPAIITPKNQMQDKGNIHYVQMIIY
mgnify:CR=1 FL=1